MCIEARFSASDPPHVSRTGCSILSRLEVRLPRKMGRTGRSAESCTLGNSIGLAERRFRMAPLPDTAVAWLASVDVMLHSIARQHRANSVGMVLSGMLNYGDRRAARGNSRRCHICAERGVFKISPSTTGGHRSRQSRYHFPPSRIAEALNAAADTRPACTDQALCEN